MFDYCQEAKKAAAELDKYDLSDILKQCYEIGWRDPWDIGERGIIGKYPELEGSVHALDLDELMEYLMEKYPVRFSEHISYAMYLVSKSNSE